jgi:peptidoglycan/xylan/chitin deacetylase (PgdA/CDA1 family)
MEIKTGRVSSVRSSWSAQRIAKRAGMYCVGLRRFELKGGAMIPVMYHYVRPWAGLPYFPYLHLDDFERQLDWFNAEYGVVSRDGFCNWLAGGKAPKGILLTFDDGLNDHREFVLPLLQERGLFALFYVPTAPLETGELLDVHKVHLSLGQLGGTASRTWLEAHAPGLLSAAVNEMGYADQHSDAETKRVKKFFNWCLKTPERACLVDGLLDHAFKGRSPLANNIYVGPSGLRELVDAGMAVGPHSHSHRVLSLLTPTLQHSEVNECCEILERLGGSRTWGFCYPYGGSDAFNQHSEAAVAKAGCPFAFANIPGDIESPLAETQRFALPRRNCNSFVHGAVSYDRLGESLAS